MYNSRKCRKSAFTFGPVAQLGERTVRIRKVEGSIPFESTILAEITANFEVNPKI